LQTIVKGENGNGSVLRFTLVRGARSDVGVVVVVVLL
jgi:hypothetical protein